MKPLYFFLILTLFTSAIYAQSNYHEGYILKNNGDTVKGYINYHDWVQSPKVIDFKTEITDKKPTRLYPTDIKVFSITGMETFFSYTGYVSTNVTSFPNYPQQVDTSRVLDTVFLRQIATGKNLTLYINEDNIKTRFFIAETNTTAPYELNYYIYYNKDNEIITVPAYSSQLTLWINKFAPDNNKLFDSIISIKYDQSHLEEFTNTLNNVNGNDIKKKKSSRFFEGIGIGSTNTQYYQSYGSQTKNSISPRISLGVDLFDNPNIQQVIFRAEVSLWYAAPRFNSSTYYPATSSTYEFNQYNFTITPQVLFNVYNTDNFKLYVDAGWAISFSTYSNNQLSTTSSDGNTTIQENPINFRGYWSNFPIQLGVVLNKKTEIYISHAFYGAYTSYVGITIENQTTTVGVKYLFK